MDCPFVKLTGNAGRFESVKAEVETARLVIVALLATDELVKVIVSVMLDVTFGAMYPKMAAAGVMIQFMMGVVGGGTGGVTTIRVALLLTTPATVTKCPFKNRAVEST